MAKKKATTKKTPAKEAKPKAAKAPKAVSVVESLLKEGQSAPAFKAQNENGETISLASLKGKKVILYFYPKDDTPGCTKESCDFRDNFARLKKADTVVLGVSRDSVQSHLKFKTKHELPFSLIADADGKITESYGVWKEKSMYGRNYMGIERTTFLIDEKGKIRKIYPKVSVTGHVDQVLQDLKSI